MGRTLKINTIISQTYRNTKKIYGINIILNVPNLKVEELKLEKNALHINCTVVCNIGQNCPTCGYGNRIKNGTWCTVVF